MPERHQDWMRQARLDLDHARLAAREGHLEWAVFAAQQAAEKACKALHMSLGGDAWGHDLTALLGACPRGARLRTTWSTGQRHSTSTTFRPAIRAGSTRDIPRDHYTGREAQVANADAEAILEFCSRSIPR